jgi:hypothetical protein
MIDLLVSHRSPDRRTAAACDVDIPNVGARHADRPRPTAVPPRPIAAPVFRVLEHLP